VVQNWRRGKARTLLELLIAQRGSVKRDVLLEILWPELHPQRALRNLRVTLFALRRSLETLSDAASPAYILTNGDNIELNGFVPLWVDILGFRSFYESAGELYRRGHVDEAVRSYLAAEALYRDDFLLDELYDQWTFIPREQFKDQYLLVTTRLTEAALAVHAYERAIEYCHKILDRDNLREDAYERLIRCHALMGRPARALRWFEICRDTLGRELGVHPSPPILELASGISSGRPVFSQFSQCEQLRVSLRPTRL
jgi:DNA-binding SARP family transcriptional activator